jgi:hypothetical protein
MREGIGLYRGKREYDGEWVYGYHYKAKYYRTDTELLDYITIPHPEENGRGSDNIIVTPETVGQYTGMEAYWSDFENEPQEADVWEGDVLEVEYDGKKVVAVVRFEVGMFILASFEFNDSYIPLFDVVEVDGDEAYIKAKVIGNIHDTPELL